MINARSYLLSHLPDEEFAKLIYYTRLAKEVIHNEKVELLSWNKRMRDHKTKIKLNIAFMEIFIGDDSRSENINTKIKRRNELKNYSLYFGIYDHGYSSPLDVVTKEFAEGAYYYSDSVRFANESLNLHGEGKLLEAFSDPEVDDHLTIIENHLNQGNLNV